MPSKALEIIRPQNFKFSRIFLESKLASRKEPAISKFQLNTLRAEKTFYIPNISGEPSRITFLVALITRFMKNKLREKCPNTEFFLIRKIASSKETAS